MTMDMLKRQATKDRWHRQHYKPVEKLPRVYAERPFWKMQYRCAGAPDQSVRCVRTPEGDFRVDVSSRKDRRRSWQPVLTASTPLEAMQGFFISL